MCLAFNMEDPSLLVSNSDDQVVFYFWKQKKIRHHSKEVSDRVCWNKSSCTYESTVACVFRSFFLFSSHFSLSHFSLCLSSSHPPLILIAFFAQDFNRPVGLLSQSCFLPGSPNHCVTGTAEGCCVVWEAVGTHEGLFVHLAYNGRANGILCHI